MQGSCLQGMVSMIQLTMRLSPGRWLQFVAAAMISACVSIPPVPSSTEQAQPAPARRVDHAAAAMQYENRAATRAPPEQVDLQLAAVREWLAAGNAADAARVLALINPARTSAQNLERSLLDAEISLVANRAAEAWQKISAISDSVAAGAGLRFGSLKMRIAMAAARPVDGVRAEIAAERWAANPAERTQLRAELLAELRSAGQRGVKLDQQTSTDAVVRGWLELGAIAAATRGTSLIGGTDASRWRERYPGHPAQELLAPTFPQPLVNNAGPGGQRRVALLLPLTGADAGGGITVRDGFLSAYYQLPAATRPDMRLYDTGALPPGEAIAQARAAGASFIVGPLTRKDVAAVADLGPQSIPLLALNYLPAERAPPSGFYQYALSPEDEARLAARRILADGHRRQGIVLAPRDDWGSRVLDAFARELAAGGGSLISTVIYQPTAHDYGDQLTSVLRTADSEAREQRLQNVLGTKLNFEPRHRGDIEFVFVAAESATNARLIEPQLKYAYAGDVPSYSNSNAYEPDSTDANKDIDGLIYPDMPWMLGEDSGVDAIRNTIGQAWSGSVAWRSRLFAFGYDACQLMLAMAAARRPADVQVAGLTGQLHLDADRRVQRDLVWVQVRDGEPKPLSTSTSTAASAIDAR